MVIPSFEIRSYDQSWNSNTDQRRVQISQEYSAHNLCHGILVYGYNKAAVTAYNDADAMKIDSQSSLFGFNVKYKSRDIINYPAVNDVNKRNQYLLDVHEKRYGKFNNALIDTSQGDDGLYWVPLTLIDLQSVDIHDNDTVNGYSGLSNQGSEIELIITNAKSGGTHSTDMRLNVVLCYYSIVTLDAKSGIVSRKNI